MVIISLRLAKKIMTKNITTIATTTMRTIAQVGRLPSHVQNDNNIFCISLTLSYACFRSLIFCFIACTEAAAGLFESNTKPI